MNSTLRNILAVIAGLVIGSIVNMGLVMLGPNVIPPPAGLDVTDAVALKASAHLLEPKHFVFPFLAHALGTLVGALCAFLIATGRRSAMALVVGAIFLGGGIAVARMIPAPHSPAAVWIQRGRPGSADLTRHAGVAVTRATPGSHRHFGRPSATGGALW